MRKALASVALASLAQGAFVEQAYSDVAAAWGQQANAKAVKTAAAVKAEKK